MGRFKAIHEEYVIGIGINESPIDEISQEEYNILTEILRNKPTAPEGYHYMLRADNLEWKLVQNPIEEETDNE